MQYEAPEQARLPPMAGRQLWEHAHIFALAMVAFYAADYNLKPRENPGVRFLSREGISRASNITFFGSFTSSRTTWKISSRR